ncbi:MAG: transcriptional repressor LexA [Candidatus Krumholzibacteria bacterium]|jgi:repressor LexA|nr:transcriptional repressor LexA [Candidatus Krumholzibacteria bacterium]MDP6669909.1 transcriptional repressor LexA [Candidatus Krumholzibacteria bacterium]MDP7021105.1 transcriptional repressor LexA [Candidatus Krumholzibacteria bacterium]
MQKKALTDRQSVILDFLRDFLDKNGYPPTLREIGGQFGIRSPRGVQDHLEALERKGYIRRERDKSRGIELLDFRPSSADSVLRLPLLGRVAAGQPVLSEENIEGWREIDSSMARNGSFLLTVTGDSMIDAHILDGDMLVVQSQEEARNGEIVVAMVDDETTVKTFYRESNAIRLQPENASMDPIIVPAGSAEIRILGKVLAVYRGL